MILPKTYTYKVFRDGVYLGTLQNVVSEFSYRQQINNGGAELNIIVNTDLDVSSYSVETIQDETGADILDESGNALLSERVVEAFGDEDSNTLIRTSNDIEVWMSNDDYPNGKLVFSGFISTWEVDIQSNNQVQIKVLNYGADLDQYLVEGHSVFLDRGSANAFNYLGEAADGGKLRVVQSFTWPTGLSYLAGVNLLAGTADNLTGGTIGNPDVVNLSVMLTNINNPWSEISDTAVYYTGAELTLEIFANQTDAESLSGSSGVLATAKIRTTSHNPTEYYLAFSQPLSGTPGNTYWMRMGVTSELPDIDEMVTLYYNSVANYSGGFRRVYDNVSWTGSAVASADVFFRLHSASGSVVADYTNMDPSNMIRRFMDNYVAQGGKVTYTGGSIDNTNTLASYGFKSNTLLEGINTALKLAPSDFYWYVDVATNILYFKEASTTANHQMIFKRHISSLNLNKTSENIKNIVYFTGGQLANGQNFYAKFINQTSLDNNRQGIERTSDSLVTDYDTAQLLANDVLERNADPVYRTTINILADTYNLELFDLGETIGFSGFGNFIDQLILQIVSKSPTPNSIDMDIGTLAPRQTNKVDNIDRQLNNLQSSNNPNTPQ